jgi:hypothetical protein
MAEFEPNQFPDHWNTPPNINMEPATFPDLIQWEISQEKPGIASCKRTKNYGKSPCLMDVYQLYLSHIQ